MNYTDSLIFDPEDAVSYYLPRGATFIGAQFVGLRLFGGKHVKVDYAAFRTKGSMDILHTQEVVFHISKVGELLPEGPAWGIPLKLNEIHYLFYAYQ